MNIARLTPARVPSLAAGVGYVVAHLSLVFAFAVIFGGDPGALVSNGAPSLAYFVLLTLFGAVLLVLAARQLTWHWWLVAAVALLVLFGSRFVFGSATGVYSVAAVFALVFLPYVVAAGVVLRLVVVRLPVARLAAAPSHPATVHTLLVAGVLLTSVVGGSVAAVAAAPPAVPPADWPADRQFDSLERTDQGDRQTGAMVDRSRDFRRAERVLSLLRDGRADSPDDWLSAAIVLQHGSCADHFEIAHHLATAANESATVEATGWVHVTYDRWQLAAGNDQRYGTQRGVTVGERACYPPVPSGLDVSDPLGQAP